MESKDRLFIPTVVFGLPETGKTTLCYLLSNKEVPESNLPICYDSIQSLEVGEKEILLRITECDGREQFLMAAKSIFINSKGCLFVYDITNAESFTGIKRCFQYFKEGLHGIEVFIVGNKCDLESSRKVSKLDGCQLAEECGAKFFEVSAKTYVNVSQLRDTLVRGIERRMEEKKSDKGLFGEFRNMVTTKIRSWFSWMNQYFGGRTSSNTGRQSKQLDTDKHSTKEK